MKPNEVEISAIIRRLAPSLKLPFGGSIAEFIEQRRILPPGSALEGPKKISRTPALKQIYEWFRDPFIREIILRKPAQFGATDLIVDLVIWIAENDPSPVGVFFADEKTARKMMYSRFKPALESLGVIVQKAANKKQQITSFECKLPNGFHLVVSWASSIAATASISFKYMFADELDKPGYQVVGAEGSTIGRLRERTETYPDHKIILLSTPAGPRGEITQEFEASDAVFDFQVKCPLCEVEQSLEWGYDPQLKDQEAERPFGVIWEGGRRATKDQIRRTARYRCQGCGEPWTTQQKNKAVKAGRMVARPTETPVERPEKIGVQLNRLSSLFPGGRLDKLVSSFIYCLKKGPLELQNFVNSTLGLPFEIKHSVNNAESDIIAACLPDLERWTVPESAVAVVISVDVQAEGFWFVCRSWARDMTSWLMGWGFVPTEAELNELLFEKTFERPDGSIVPVWRACLDTGGGLHSSGKSSTEYVYDWFIRNRFRGIGLFLFKGSSRVLPGKLHVGKPLEKLPSGVKVPPGVLLQIVELDTVQLKDEFFWRLEKARNKETGAAYLPQDIDQDYVRQITSEEKVTTARGRIEYKVKGSRANHLLDCEQMQLALVSPQLGGGVRIVTAPKPKQGNNAPRAKSTTSSKGGWIKQGGWL